MYLTITGMKNIIRYTEDFVIQRFVISRFQCMFAITRFRYIEVLFHTFDYYWDEEYHSLYQGLRYSGALARAKRAQRTTMGKRIW